MHFLLLWLQIMLRSPNLTILSGCVLMPVQSTATPRLYQEIRERGLHSTNQDELLDDFVVVEPPQEDQGIVVKSYRPAQLTWSQLPQVKPLADMQSVCKQVHTYSSVVYINPSQYSFPPADNTGSNRVCLLTFCIIRGNMKGENSLNIHTPQSCVCLRCQNIH